VQRRVCESFRRPAADGFEKRRGEERRDPEQDQPERPVTGREENDREHEDDHDQAEEEALRRHTEPARLRLAVGHRHAAGLGRR
jgi:hypothetical protein